MQACGQKGRCTTCAFEVLSGAQNLTQLTENEMRFRAAGRLPENYRLACQAKATGDVMIRVPESVKLPHIKYSDA